MKTFNEEFPNMRGWFKPLENVEIRVPDLLQDLLIRHNSTGKEYKGIQNAPNGSYSVLESDDYDKSTGIVSLKIDEGEVEWCSGSVCLRRNILNWEGNKSHD